MRASVDMKTMRLFRCVLMAALATISGCDGDESNGTAASSCGTFSACGGELDGTWQIDDACVGGALLGSLNSELASLPAACHTIFKAAELEVSGTIRYEAGIETTNTTLLGIYSAVYSKECLSAVAGDTITATQDVCAAAETSVEGTEGMAATCTVANGGCSCSIQQQLSAGTQTASYTVEGNALVYSSSGESNAFCVKADSMQMRQSLAALGITIDVDLHRIE